MSSFTDTGASFCHSGVKYLLVPSSSFLILEWSDFSSLANPKSEIFAVHAPSISIFRGFMLQWIIRTSHSSCRYSTPLAMSNAIFSVSLRDMCFSSLKRKLARDPLLMYS
ncbi:hypothetical protein GLYMA_17G114750v4 [Glycine max]|nr:hypothetical protein GLYMA_17G114750v4 [Glycine max]KAH1117997.1 hypothetical protein GYH30_046978 [Glycine max]